ncbi:MAG TPA: hypothetical protein VF796_02635 [Humisphaera sp.]
MSILNTIVGTVTGRIVGGIVTAGVLAGGIALWRMEPAQWDSLKSGTGSVLSFTAKLVGWVLAVGVLPWATFFLSTYAARFSRNVAGVVLVGLYTAVGVAGLLWLFDWSLHGATAWVFFVAATLIALVYNVLICDWIAERFAGA